MNEEKLLTYKAASEILGVSSRTIRNWVNRGVLPVVWICGTKRIRRQDLDRLCQATYRR